MDEKKQLSDADVSALVEAENAGRPAIIFAKLYLPCCVKMSIEWSGNNDNQLGRYGELIRMDVARLSRSVQRMNGESVILH